MSANSKIGIVTMAASRGINKDADDVFPKRWLFFFPRLGIPFLTTPSHPGRRFCSPSNHFPLPPSLPLLAAPPPIPPSFPLSTFLSLKIDSWTWRLQRHPLRLQILLQCKSVRSYTQALPEIPLFLISFPPLLLALSSHSCPDTTQQRARPYFNPNTVSANSSPWRITNLRLSRTINHPAYLRHHHHLISSCQSSRKEANVHFRPSSSSGNEATRHFHLHRRAIGIPLFAGFQLHHPRLWPDILRQDLHHDRSGS